MLRSPLLRRINLYLRRSGTSATRFGREAARDPRLVWDLRAGRLPRPTLERRIAAWLERCEAELEGERCSR
jgi:hypothetical protein